MAMLLTCSACFSNNYHKLNTETNDVICSDCGKIVAVTKYAKTALLSQGQVFSGKQKASMEVQCKNCGALEAPVLLKLANKSTAVGCKLCHEVNVHLTKYFLSALKMKADIETIDISRQSAPVESEAAISKTASGAVVANKLITTDTNPKFKQAVAAALDDGMDDNGRPKISTSTKTKADADAKEVAMREKFKSLM